MDWAKIQEKLRVLFSSEDTVDKIVQNPCFPNEKCLKYRIEIDWLAHQSPSLVKALFTDPVRFEEAVFSALSSNGYRTDIPVEFYLYNGPTYIGPEDILHPSDLRKLKTPNVVRLFARISAVRYSGDALIYVAGFKCYDCGNVMFRYYTPGSPLPEPRQCDACGGRHNIKLEPSISQIFDFHEFEVTIKDPITGEQVQIPVIFIFDDETPSKNLPHLGEDVQIIGILRYSHYTKEKAVPLIEAFKVEKLSPKPIRLQDEVKNSEEEWNTLRKSLQNVSYDVLANYLLPGKIPTEEKLLLLGLMLAPFKEEYGLSESPSALFVKCGDVPHASRLFQSAWDYEKLAPWLVGYYNALVRNEPLLLTKGKEFSPIFGDKKPTLRAEEMLLYKWGTLLIDHGEALSKRELSRIAHWVSDGEIYEELGRWVRYRISGGTRVAMSIELKNSVKDPRKALNRVFGYPDHAKFWFVYFENNDPPREEYNIHFPSLPDQYEIMYFATLHSLEVDVDRERFREFMSWFVDNRESATQWSGFRLMSGLYRLAKGLAALKFKRVADEEVFEVLRRISMHLV